MPFYKELGNQKISAEDIPVVAFSVGEEELSGLDTKPLVGHLAAWNYFMSVNTPANKAFIDQWNAYIKNPKRTTNDPMEAHYIGFNLWVKAVEKASSTDVDKVLAALPGLEVPNLTGGIAKMLPNHHITKPVYIGEVRADGQFDVVWKTTGTVPGDAWSDFLPGSKDIEADWVTLKCGNYNTKTKGVLGTELQVTLVLLGWRTSRLGCVAAARRSSLAARAPSPAAVARRRRFSPRWRSCARPASSTRKQIVERLVATRPSERAAGAHGLARGPALRPPAGPEDLHRQVGRRQPRRRSN